MFTRWLVEMGKTLVEEDFTPQTKSGFGRVLASAVWLHNGGNHVTHDKEQSDFICTHFIWNYAFEPILNLTWLSIQDI